MRQRAEYIPIACAILIVSAQSLAASAAVTTETDTDRPGADYKSFDVYAKDPTVCAKACDGEANCEAYTYVRPGFQGGAARCYLKSSVPAKVASACCISGVRAQRASRSSTSSQVPAPRSGPDSGASIARPSGGVAIAKPPIDPGAIGKGHAEGSLNGKNPASFGACNANTIGESVFQVLDMIAEAFGAGIAKGAHCGAYKREVAAGVTVFPAPPSLNFPQWDYLGGRGDLMADAGLCLMKDILDGPNGRITRVANTEIASLAKISIKQTVGLSAFNAAKKSAQLYQQVEVCAPILGCLDTQRQTIDAVVRRSEPAWPANRMAGDYPIRDSYSLELATTWGDSNFSAKLPPITVVTPYGNATVQPGFSYFSSLYPIDTPFSKGNGATVAVNHPDGRADSLARVDDIYGRTGAPLRIHLISNLPKPTAEPPYGWPADVIFPPDLPPDLPQGWSSQILFGSRHGVATDAFWTPSLAGGWPARPDLDTDAPRNDLERQPSANFIAESAIKITPPGVDLARLVPPSVADLKEFNLVVTPRLAANYAAQLGLIERETRYTKCELSAEFDAACGLAETLLYAQTRADGRAEITVKLNLRIGFNIPFAEDFECCDPVTVPLGTPQVDFDPGKPDNSSDYAAMARASVRGGSPHDDLSSYVIGLSGKTNKDVRKWRDQCLATSPSQLSKPPPPKIIPGGLDELADLLPCNICIAEHGPTFYIPANKVPDAFPQPQKWSCGHPQNSGCFDLCTYEKTANGGAIFTEAKKSAVEIFGNKCRAPVR